MRILHVCDGWERWNGAANIARMIADEQARDGHAIEFRRWASLGELRMADQVWIHCGWKPCLWWAALVGRHVHWVPEACYDPIRLNYHGWKKRLAGLVERGCLRRCERLEACCEAEAGWIRGYLGRKCPEVAVQDIKRFFTFAPIGALDRTHPLHVLYLGRRHPLKGLEFLEAAVNRVRQDGQAVELKIASTAFGEEKERVWAWCDVLCLPTLSDNFGLVVAEALERGKRVITTDGAPAWKGQCGVIYLEGYVAAEGERRVAMLKAAIEEVLRI